MFKRFLVLLIVVSVGATLRPAAAQDQPFAVRTIPLKNMPSFDMRVSPDGKTAAVYLGRTAAIYLNVPFTGYTVSPEMLTIHLIDLATGSETGQLTGYTDLVADAQFSADSKQFFAEEADSEIDIWDVASQKHIRQLTGIVANPGQIRATADGKTLFVRVGAVVDQYVSWDIQAGTITKVIHPPYTSFGALNLNDVLSRLDYEYPAFDISPDGKLLANSTGNGKVSLWNLDTLKETVVQNGPTQKGLLNVRQIQFSADGKTLVYYDDVTKNTTLWDVATASVAKQIPSGSHSFVLSADGKLLAFGTSKNVSLVKVDDPSSVTNVMDVPSGAHTSGAALKFSPDGKQLIVGGFYVSSGDNALYVVSLQK